MRELALRRRILLIAVLVEVGIAAAILAVDPQRGQAHGGPMLALWLSATAIVGFGTLWWYRRSTERLEAAMVVDPDGVSLGAADRVARAAVWSKTGPVVAGLVAITLVGQVLQWLTPGELAPWWAQVLAIGVGVAIWHWRRQVLRSEPPGPASELRWRDLA